MFRLGVVKPTPGVEASPSDPLIIRPLLPAPWCSGDVVVVEVVFTVAPGDVGVAGDDDVGGQSCCSEPSTAEGAVGMMGVMTIALVA